MSLSRSQDNRCFQNSQDSLQEKSRCSMDLSSFWQKAYDWFLDRNKTYSQTCPNQPPNQGFQIEKK